MSLLPALRLLDLTCCQRLKEIPPGLQGGTCGQGRALVVLTSDPYDDPNEVTDSDDDDSDSGADDNDDEND